MMKAKGRSSLDLAVMVLSYRGHVKIRSTIRNTWASRHDNVYFMVGKACPF